jgi:hypothetical protein
MNNKTILAIVFLLAGTLLSSTSTMAMAPVFAEDDDYDKRHDDDKRYGNGGDGNKQKVEDDSAGAIADCDKNDVEDSEFDCIAAAATEESVIRDREPTLPPEPEPETCEECFEAFLSQDEIEDLEAALQEANQAESLQEFCEGVLEPGFISEGEVRNFLTIAGVDEDTQDALIECLEDVGIIFEPDM